MFLKEEEKGNDLPFPTLSSLLLNEQDFSVK